jgi:hypothetical protein
MTSENYPQIEPDRTWWTDAVEQGASIRHSAAVPFPVVMIKSSPGVYYDKRGNRVSEEIARKAGIPVEKYARERIKAERLDAAKRAIEADLATIEAPARQVLAERGGFELIDIGLGRAMLVAPDGLPLTEAPLTVEQGQKLLEKLAPAEDA